MLDEASRGRVSTSSTSELPVQYGPAHAARQLEDMKSCLAAAPLTWSANKRISSKTDTSGPAAPLTSRSWVIVNICGPKLKSS
jgi:hypothetical protein